MRSVHNTPIEGLWHWFLVNNGLNIKDAIRKGYHDGVYNPKQPGTPVRNLPNYYIYGKFICTSIFHF